LMNDWEIGGTQNKWVCPSDRHLHLRAQITGLSSIEVFAEKPALGIISVDEHPTRSSEPPYLEVQKKL
ncbi:hypothetical protein ANCDUO_16930, partial [Ancylostoma duodenale]